MKKILFSLSAIVMAAMVLVSCSKTSPKEVAKTWLTSFYHMDYEAAKKVSTEETKSFISQLQALSSMMPDSAKKEMQKITINVKDEQVEGDSVATVTYNVVSGKAADAPKDETLKLVKKGDKWLVQFSKNDGNDAAADEEPAADEGSSPADTTGTAEGDAADTAKHE